MPVIVALHCGGRKNIDTHHIKVNVPAGESVMPYSTLRQECCKQLKNHNRLTENNLQFADVEIDGWKPCQRSQVELQEQQQEVTVSAVVMPVAVAAGKRMV